MASTRAEVTKRIPRTELVTILDDLDFSWTQEQIRIAVAMWKSGFGIPYMASKLRPLDKPDDANAETTLLIMHLGRQGMIDSRPGGIYGDDWRDYQAMS